MLIKMGMFVPIDFVFREDRIQVEWKFFFIYWMVSKLDFFSIGQ